MLQRAMISLSACLCACTSPAATPRTPPPAPLARPPAQRSKLVVMPLQADGRLERTARAMDELLLTTVHELGTHEVMGPTDLNAMLGVEATKDALGCDNVVCAADLGGALGATQLIAGRLHGLQGQVVLALRLMDTRSPAVLERGTARGETRAESLAWMVSAAVSDLFHTHADVPLGMAPPRDENDAWYAPPGRDSWPEIPVRRATWRRRGGHLPPGPRRPIGGAVPPRTASSEPAAIEQVVRKRVRDVQRCYERALLTRPRLGGRMVVEWTIRGDGGVREARIVSSQVKSQAVADCILHAIRTWRFTPPRRGPIEVRYPFLFESTSF